MRRRWRVEKPSWAPRTVAWPYYCLVTFLPGRGCELDGPPALWNGQDSPGSLATGSSRRQITALCDREERGAWGSAQAPLVFWRDDVKRRKRPPRQYPAEPMRVGGMSKVEHVAVALMGDVVDLRAKVCGRLDVHRAWLVSSPWYQGPTDDPADNGYLVAVGQGGAGGPSTEKGARLRVTRVGTEQRWDAWVPWKRGLHHFKFRHDDLTVLVHVEMTFEGPDS